MWQDGEIVSSIATLGTDFVHAGIDEDFGNGKEMRRENDDFQWMSAVRERAWFTGSSGNPTDATPITDTVTAVGKTNGSGTNQMPGIASLVTERSGQRRHLRHQFQHRSRPGLRRGRRNLQHP